MTPRYPRLTVCGTPSDRPALFCRSSILVGSQDKEQHGIAKEEHMTTTTTMKVQLVATLSVWCWTACSTTAFVVPKFATARRGVVVEAAQRETVDERSSWGSVAATSAAFVGFTLATSQAAWAQAPLPVVPSTSSGKCELSPRYRNLERPWRQSDSS